MNRVKRNDNFINKTFTIVANILSETIYIMKNKQKKQAFFYYRDGMSAQADGKYAEARKLLRSITIRRRSI